MPKIWPISSLYFPLVHDLGVSGVVNSFGSGYEQRIITDIPRGPRADGEGDQTTYVGQNIFRIDIRNLQYNSMPHATNAAIDNSFSKLWNFYKSCFYDPATGQIFWQPFYIYNPTENDNVATWTGDVASAGVNSQNKAVTNLTGRYLVRFSSPNLSMTRFRQCLFRGGLTVVEVVS